MMGRLFNEVKFYLIWMVKRERVERERDEEEAEADQMEQAVHVFMPAAAEHRR